MKIAAASGLLLVCSVACGNNLRSGEDSAPQSAPEEQQEASTAPELQGIELRLTTYSGGYCAVVETGSAEPSERIVDSCHGWAIHGCANIVFAVSREVRIQQGRIIFQTIDPSRIIDVGNWVQQGIEDAYGSSFEYLHLRFASAQCTRQGMSISFEGSIIGKGESGSANGMEGVLDVAANGTHRVEVRNIPTTDDGASR